jgi:hypothetical protein
MTACFDHLREEGTASADDLLSPLKSILKSEK